jgi:HlyD family secretion protein
MRMPRRALTWGIAGVLAALLVWRALRPEVLQVDAAAAAHGPLMVTVGDQGESRARHRHVVTAPSAGRVERIALEVGDRVLPGTVVARLAPVSLDARGREQARAALGAARDLERVAAAVVGEARAALEQARADRQRAERLLSGGGIAPAEAERLALIERGRAEEVTAAEARHRAAVHDVEAARSLLESDDSRTVPIVCPLGGVVLGVPEPSARTVAPGEPLLEVGDPRDLEVVVDLLSADAVRVEVGAPMRVTGWGGPGTLTGRIVRVDPAGFTKVSALGVEEQRVNVVGALDSVPASLGHRFRVDVRVVLWAADSVLAVPSSALFRRGDQWAVYRIENSRARERPVTVGHESASDSEILEGLAPGDLVIRHPSDRIRDGVRIRATTSRPGDFSTM